ncbi:MULTISPECIES: precorrin-2 C(20)-methyltransferase [Methanobacterium]|uniref:Potassium transporter TrkA n=1 Tax=Methanobacterium bryantii TaxID=2161 RepID=A0A2A2H0W7_METBR|nr:MULTISPECIES: precorrin-2 C(20)-methyltransferase [Methanobacterium]OEC86390.1 precorrin-2 C(20)-methyltransferase [Methanobacterium sp. A39]PAV03051.1 potassium transporter TrkA [Methanobacterium bryantii]
MKKGKFIGIGVGPGDPDLLTVKAVKTLNEVDVICAPKSSKSKPSVALSIIDPVLNDRKSEYETLEPLFPMIENKKELQKYWADAAQVIIEKLNEGLDVAFITLGDPSVYSTFSYVFKIIEGMDFETMVIPGITSFTGCAASAKMQLAEKDEIMVIVPKVDERLSQIMACGDTFVIMKTSRHSDMLEDIINQDKRDKEIISVQNCSMNDEKIFDGFVEDKKYLSTTIVKFKNKK